MFRLLVPVMIVAALTCAGCVADRAAPSPEAPAGASAEPRPWPPRLDEIYPDLQLRDPEGHSVSLSEFKGRVILLEPIGVGCPACQAFAGGNLAERGPLRGCKPQRGLRLIEEYVAQYCGGLALDDPRIVYIQLLLYDWSASRAPTLEESREWTRHFASNGTSTRVVLVGGPNLINRASYDMIPGFQLIDRDFVLRVDSTGHAPRHNLYRELLPKLKELVDAPPRAGRDSGSADHGLQDHSLSGGHGHGSQLTDGAGSRWVRLGSRVP